MKSSDHMLNQYDWDLISLLDKVFKDQSVPDNLRIQMQKFMYNIEDEKNSPSLYCLRIERILTNHFLTHQSHNPQSLKDLYHFVLARGERYHNWANGFFLSSLWRLF